MGPFGQLQCSNAFEASPFLDDLGYLGIHEGTYLGFKLFLNKSSLERFGKQLSHRFSGIHIESMTSIRLNQGLSLKPCLLVAEVFQTVYMSVNTIQIDTSSTI